MTGIINKRAMAKIQRDALQNLNLLKQNLTKLLNQYNFDTLADLPDFIIAAHLVRELEIFCLTQLDINKLRSK